MHSSRIGAVHFAQGLALNETAPYNDDQIICGRMVCPKYESAELKEQSVSNIDILTY